MKKSTLLILLSLIGFNAYSQIIFEKGYFINESNEKIDCFIKNVDWKNNPTEFEYKLMDSETVQKATMETVKEFSISNVSKYIKSKVNIDKSSDNVNEMDTDSEPNFQESTLFLKVLIEGKASLYYYTDGNLKRFFYSTDNSDIEQLVYKRFIIYRDYYIRMLQNNSFRKQLHISLICEAIEFEELNKLNYTKQDLQKLFIKYNECSNSNYTNFNQKQKRDLFNLTIRPGVNYSSFSVKNSVIDSYDTNFDSNLSFRFGVEAEFFLPSNKNKWSIILEPTYQYYKSVKSKETTDFSGGMLISEVDYKSIGLLPIGIRYYMYFNKNSKMFVNLSYVISSTTGSTLKFSRKDGSRINELELKSRNNIDFGLGYKYLDKYSVELRYNGNRELLSDYVYWTSNYNGLAIIFGYSIL